MLHRVNNRWHLAYPHENRDQRVHKIKRIGSITQRNDPGEHTRLAEIDPGKRK